MAVDMVMETPSGRFENVMDRRRFGGHGHPDSSDKTFAVDTGPSTEITRDSRKVDVSSEN